VKKALKLVFLLNLFYFSWVYLFAGPTTWTVLDNVNLGIHEFGHLFVNLISNNRRLITLGGTLFQVLIPAIFLFYFYKRRDKYGVIFSIFWLGQNFINISIYIADAKCMCLPLLGGKHSTHDWNYLLSYYGLVDKYSQISGVVSGVGRILIVLSLALTFNIIATEYKKVKNDAH